MTNFFFKKKTRFIGGTKRWYNSPTVVATSFSWPPERTPSCVEYVGVLRRPNCKGTTEMVLGLRPGVKPVQVFDLKYSHKGLHV